MEGFPNHESVAGDNGSDFRRDLASFTLAVPCQARIRSISRVGVLMPWVDFSEKHGPPRSPLPPARHTRCGTHCGDGFGMAENDPRYRSDEHEFL